MRLDLVVLVVLAFDLLAEIGTVVGLDVRLLPALLVLGHSDPP